MAAISGSSRSRAMRSALPKKPRAVSPRATRGQKGASLAVSSWASAAPPRPRRAQPLPAGPGIVLVEFVVPVVPVVPAPRFRPPVPGGLLLLHAVPGLVDIRQGQDNLAAGLDRRRLQGRRSHGVGSLQPGPAQTPGRVLVIEQVHQPPSRLVRGGAGRAPSGSSLGLVVAP